MDNIENVVVVVIDALRADRVSAVGGREGLTPNLDALAEDGTAFENAFTAASNTDPSVTSLLTGRYPLNTVYHHGRFVTDEEKRRIEAVKPLPAVLSDAGLETVAVGQALGRWHARGFDRYPDASAEDRLRPTAMSIARSVFDRVNALAPRLGSTIRSVYSASHPGMKSQTVMQDYDPTELLSYVGSDPFFGFVHLMEPHMPYLGTVKDFDELVASWDYPEATATELLAERDVTDAQRERIESALDSQGLDRPGELLALYDASVRLADRKVGRLIEAFREAGRWEETTLFVTADHGESLLEHGIYFDHHGLYDDVFRVPLVCDLGDGERVSDIVQLIDLAPTVLDLLGIDGPETDGNSLRPLIGGKEWDGRPAAFAEEAYTERRVAVRTDRWKYIRNVPDPALEAERGSSLECGYCKTVHGSERELFDLEADPQECQNVINDQRHVAEMFDSRYETFVTNLVDPQETRDDVRYENEDEVLDRLEAIGYR